MISVKDQLDEIREDIFIRQNRWENVIEKVGTAYHDAYHNHHDHLPERLQPPRPPKIAIEALKLAAKPSLKVWCLGATDVIMIPVKEGIDYLGRVGASSAGADRILAPAVSLTPLHFRASLRFALRTVCDRFRSSINEIRRSVNRGTASVSAEDLAKAQDSFRRSPFWYVPDDWDVWNVNAIADEVERGFWAIWALQLGSREAMAHAVPNVQRGAIDFRKTLDRLAYLGVRLPHGLDKLARQKDSWTNMVHATSWNLPVMQQLAEWARNYRPARTFGGDLPLIVREYFDARGLRDLARGMRPLAETVAKGIRFATFQPRAR